LSGFGTIIRPTSGGNAPRNVNTSGRGNQPFRYVRPMGPGGSSAAPWLYVGARVSGTLYRVNSATGEYSELSTGVLTTVKSISCDPTTGNIYIASGTADIVCMDSDGAVLWTVTKGGGATVSDVCVSNDGYVYAAFQRSGSVEGKVFKLDAITGTEITTGWPYAPAFITASFNCVCVDQSGNVYAGCNNDGYTVRAVSLTSSGTVRWTSSVENTPATSGFQGVMGLAINAGGTTLIASRQTDTGEPAVDSHYFLDSTAGTVNSSFRPTSGTGVPLADGCDYGGITGNVAYSTNTSSNAAIADVFAGTGPLFNTATTNSAGGVVSTRKGGVFVTAQADPAIPQSNYNVYKCVSGGWKINLPASLLMVAIESSEGRIGAFGL